MLEREVARQTKPAAVAKPFLNLEKEYQFQSVESGYVKCEMSLYFLAN